MAATTFSCPECNKVLKSANPLPDGKKIKCPQCETVFAVSNGSNDNGKKKAASPIRAKHDTPMPPPRRTKKVDDDDDEEVRRRAKRRSAVDDDDLPAAKSKRKAALRDDDDYEDEVVDDDEDDDEDERPRKSSKSKKGKKQKGNGMLIGMILGGAGLALIGIFVLTAFVWPGFLRGSSLPAGTGQENLLAFMPAKCDLLIGGRGDANFTIDDASRLLEQLSSKNPKTKGKIPPGVLQTLRDSERVVVGADFGSDKDVTAFITKKPYDRDKMKKAFQAGAAVDLQGKVGYRLKIDGKDGCLAMPNNRVLLWGDVSDAEFGSLAASDGVTPKIASDILAQAQRMQSHPAWAVFSLDGKARAVLQQGLDAMAFPGGKEIKGLLQPVMRARLASLWLESVNQDSKIVAGLTFANDNDAKTLKDQIKNFWDTQAPALLSLASLALAGQKGGNEAVTDLIKDVTKSFQVQNQGPLLSISVQLSQKTVKDLLALAKASMPQAGPGGMPGGGMPGMPGGGMPGMPGGGMPGGMQGKPGGQPGGQPGGFPNPGGQNPGFPGGQNPGGQQPVPPKKAAAPSMAPALAWNQLQPLFRDGACLNYPTSMSTALAAWSTPARSPRPRDWPGRALWCV